MNLITVYNNDLDLIKSDFDIFLLTQKGLNSHYLNETTNIKETIEAMHLANKKAYGWINRFIFEDEMVLALEKVKQLIEFGVDGFVVNDFGFLLELKKLGFNLPIVLSTNTTITNYLEINDLTEVGYNQVVIARELTFDEIKELAVNVSHQMIVPILGHQIMSTSRRQLIEAYGNLINRPLNSNHIYRLREATRKDYYLVLQDETGTHIFDEKVLMGFEGLADLLDLNIKDFLVDSFNLSTNELIDAARILKQIGNRKMTGKEGLELFLERHSNLKYTSALWYLKTAEKKEDL